MKASTFAFIMALSMALGFTVTTERHYWYSIILFISTALICAAIEDNKTKK